MAIAAVSSNLSSATAATRFNSARRAAEPFGQSLSSAASSQLSQSAGGASGDAAIHLNELRQAATLSLSEFKRMLRQVFVDAGVDTSQPIRLEPDGNGGVTLVGQHPDRDKIERIFAENPDLTARFQALAQRFTEMRGRENGNRSDQPLMQPVFGLSILNEDVEVAFR